MVDNAYRGEPIYSRDACQLMRDINALEAAVSSGSATEVMSATDGTSVYVMADKSRAVKVFSCTDGSYSTTWNLPAFTYDDETNIGINYDGPYLYVTRSRGRDNYLTTAIELSTSGTVSKTQTLAVWSDAALADANGIYCVGFTSVDDTGALEPRRYIYKYSWPGAQLWRTTFLEQRLAINFIGRPRLRLIGNLYSAVAGQWGVRYGYGVAMIAAANGDITLPRSESEATYGLVGFRHFLVVSNGYLLMTGVSTTAFKPYYFDTAFEYDAITTATLPESGEQGYVTLCGDYGGGFVYVISGQPGGYHFYKLDVSDWSTDVDDASLALSWGDQTHWYAYTHASKTSLGAPDSGVSVPDLEALTPMENAGTVLSSRTITDMRDAVEAVAPFYENSITTNAFNWTDASADNLYYVAMGDRTDYGATGGARYDWTHSAAELIGNPCYDIDIGEIYECVERLRGSNPV